MPKDELSQEQVREKLERKVKMWRKWAWLCRTNVALFLVLFLIFVYLERTGDAMVFLFVFMVFLVLIGQQNLYALILKMLPPK